jgi:SulP family sulfate permease
VLSSDSWIDRDTQLLALLATTHLDESVPRLSQVIQEENKMAAENQARIVHATTSMLDRLPLIRLLRTYRRDWIGGDLRGGISASLVMIPSVIAYAELAHLQPVYGLYAALLGMLGYAFFASSPQVIAGPDGAITLLVVSAVAPLAGGDPARTASLSATMALMGGALMLLAASMRVGMIADFLSKPVLIGYMTGAALILVSTQLGRLFGLALEQQNFFPLLLELATKLGQTHVLTLCVGLGFFLLLIVAHHWIPKLPGALVVVVLALAMSAVFDLERHGVRVIGHVPRGLPLPRVPWATLSDLQQLLPGALGIALLTFPDGVLLARAFAVKNHYAIRPTQELRALAAANIAASFFQGFSVGASQSRTTVNDAAGGRTQMASLVAVASLSLFLIFLTPVLRSLPTVALSAILIFAGVNLVDVGAYRVLRRLSRPAFAIALLVTAGVLVGGMVPGMLIGVMVSLIMLLGRLARPTDAVLLEVTGTGKFHDLGEADASETVPGLIAYRFYAPLFFANADHLVERVHGLIAGTSTPVRWFVMDVQAVTDIDVTGADALSRLIEELRLKGIDFKLARANRPLREKLAHFGLQEQLSETTLFPSVHAAIAKFQQQLGTGPANAPLHGPEASTPSPAG